MKALVIVGCIIAFIILVACILWDIVLASEYKHATVCNGVIIKNLGEVKKDTYGSGIAHQQRRTYEKYLVEYSFNGDLRQDEVLTKLRGLSVGDKLEVHVHVREDGGYSIASDIHKQRLIELIIALIGGVILSVIIMFLKGKGVM